MTCENCNSINEDLQDQLRLVEELRAAGDTLAHCLWQATRYDLRPDEEDAVQERIKEWRALQ
jgi:hypothetical protein